MTIANVVLMKKCAIIAALLIMFLSVKDVIHHTSFTVPHSLLRDKYSSHSSDYLPPHPGPLFNVREAGHAIVMAEANFMKGTFSSCLTMHSWLKKFVYFMIA